MKITLESTTKIVDLRNEHAGSRGSVPARIWEGKTESGIPVHAYITRIAVDRMADVRQFNEELEKHRAPSADLDCIPLRLIL